MKFRSSFTRRTYESDRKSLVICHRYESSFAITRQSFDTDVFCIDGFVCFEVVECTTCTPGPCAQRTPIVQLSWLALVAKTNDPLRKTSAVVSLNCVWNQTRESPTLCEQLLLP